MSRQKTDDSSTSVEGSRPDWDAWLDAHCARLLLYARSQTRSESDAEDLLQIALIRLVRAVESGEFRKTQEQWAAYVLSCIRHDAIDLQRRRNAGQRTERVAATQQPQVEECKPWLTCQDDAVTARDEVERLLRNMREDYAELIILHVWQELPFREIAEMLALPLQTVVSRYRSAMKFLRQHLNPDYLTEW